MMARVAALGLGATGLVAYAALRIAGGHGAAPSVVGCLLGLVVLALVARRR